MTADIVAYLVASILVVVLIIVVVQVREAGRKGQAGSGELGGTGVARLGNT